LTLICSDSRVSYFLFSKKVQDSTKKFIRWALKLQLDYPEVRIVNISGANNIADYLSRIGVSKATWFGKSLYPLMIDEEERKKLPDMLTWNDLIKYCDDNPLVKFSEQKLDTRVMNQNYIYSVDKISHFVKVNSLKTFKTQTNFLDKYLTRENLIKKQLLEIIMYH